mgnify:CR=1 FL=1
MVTSVLDEVRDETAGEREPPLSEESEQEILEMVERQLDRPNPPDTRVLYRRAMHFIDRDVRHLSLQQFNAKFPLQVKRRRARERLEENGGSPDGAGGDVGSEPSRQRSSTNRTQSRDSTMAVDRNPDVMEMVERELRENRDVSNRHLKRKAEEIDEGISELSTRQFHARYPLQVKRKLSSVKSEVEEKRGDGSRAPRESDERRDAVREALLDFAKAVAGARDRGEVIDVLTDVDEYVDRVVRKM